MIEAVFISDLHLSPSAPGITDKFNKFISWAAENTNQLFILGDFFHAWAGDDTMDEWSESIAQRLAWLTAQGVKVSFLPGNRDFLLGMRFAEQAKICMLSDPYLLDIGNERILLTHGDQYCTRDRGHQWLRWFTRNAIFPKLFLLIPRKIRQKIVLKVRSKSQNAPPKSQRQLEVVPEAMLSQMEQYKVDTIIHGHIHKPGTQILETKTGPKEAHVLSDWDDNPTVMCYDLSYRLKLTQIEQGYL